MEGGERRPSAAEEHGALTTRGPITEEGTGLWRAIAAGLVTAIATGIVWGLIVKTTEYEIGFAAWGVGFVVGTAVVLASGRKGVPIQVVAVVSALLGILLGKYLAFAWVLQDIASEEGVSLPIFSADTVDIFLSELGVVFSLWDLLWVGLAVVTAWRIAQPDEPQPAAETASG